MAATSEQYDACSYSEKLRRSTGPGMYLLSTPANDCASCSQDIPLDPYMRYQHWGPGACAPGQAVDDGSELRGLNYKNSKCSADRYLPGKYPSKGACQVPGTKAQCAAPTEDTRLSNPPCTLRGTGWNRWEWLCVNPQDHAMIPFEWNVSYRTVVKDNHVPILPTPMDQSKLFPAPTVASPMKAWEVNTSCKSQEMPWQAGNPFSLSMDTCKNIQQL